MAEISLSSAIRQNLLSLQSTAEMMSKTQNRLSTGLKVNSALDDPTAYFTASSLNSRASDLNRLLDSVSNAVQTVKAADDGISAITKLVESAQATARQALQKPSGSTTALTLTGSVTIQADTAAQLTGTVDTLTSTTTLDTVGVGNNQTVTVTIGSTTATFTAAADSSTQDIDDLIAGLNTGLGTAGSVALTNGALVVTAASNTDTITMGGTATIADLGFGTGNTTASATNSQVAAMTGTLSITDGDGTAETIDLSTINTRAALDTALQNLTITASVNSSGNVTITASDYKNDITISGGDPVGLTNGTNEANYNSERATLETEFNNLRTQIDQLASDASFNGVNLLNGDSLSVIFNEDGSSSLSLTGVTFNSTGLSISEAATDSFQSDTNINSTLSQLDKAITSLRSQGSTFGSNLSVIEVRQDFTKNLINTLETGAAKLTLADVNEEGANMLALQTRQQLSSVALSMAAQADQQVLRLF